VKNEYKIYFEFENNKMVHTLKTDKFVNEYNVKDFLMKHIYLSSINFNFFNKYFNHISISDDLHNAIISTLSDSIIIHKLVVVFENPKSESGYSNKATKDFMENIFGKFK